MGYDQDLQKAIDFHGHFCPGLAIGYRAAQAARETLGIDRAGDEELVAIVETDACSVDAIQSVLGCTIGKGKQPLPQPAKIFKSVICEYCGEKTMEPRARIKDGKIACLSCCEEYTRGW